MNAELIQFTVSIAQQYAVKLPVVQYFSAPIVLAITPQFPVNVTIATAIVLEL